MILPGKFKLKNICVIFSKCLLLAIVFGVSCFYIYLFSEFIINYVKLAQCDWPKLGDNPPSFNPRTTTNSTPKLIATSESPLRVMLVTDTHLLGTRKPVWIERKLRDWLLHWSFQAAVGIHDPDVIFMLGDIMDEGLFAGEEEFGIALQRFYTVFAVPNRIPMHVLVGNHDIGFHSEVTQAHWKRFNEAFNTTDVQLISIRGVHFVAINSVAMHEDDCFMCSAAEKQLDDIELILKCSSTEAGSEICEDVDVLKDFSRPIVLQHYPFFRTNAIRCRDHILAPMSFSKDLEVDDISPGWIPKRSCLSLNATLKILDKVSPRAAYCGHTHVACTLPFLKGEGIEHTLATFNRRMKPMPTFTLAVFTPDNYNTVNCFLPQVEYVTWFMVVLVILSTSAIFVCLVTCTRGRLCFGAPINVQKCDDPT